jgi:hypothetical protein
LRYRAWGKNFLQGKRLTQDLDQEKRAEPGKNTGKEDRGFGDSLFHRNFFGPKPGVFPGASHLTEDLPKDKRFSLHPPYRIFRSLIKDAKKGYNEKSPALAKNGGGKKQEEFWKLSS